MGRIIYLKLETEKGIITIPFPNIEMVDAYTVIYKNMGELVNSVIRILNLELDLYDVLNVYLTNDKYNRGLDDDCLPIKYSGDNFNYESLNEAFVQYLKNDFNRILTTDVRYVRSREMLKFLETRMLDNYELDRLVRAFFSYETSYKRKRDVYFLLKDSLEVDVKIDKVKGLRRNDRYDLSVFATEEDNYLNYLIQLSKKSPEDFERAMDEIGRSDLEEVNSLLKNDGYGIIDGVSDESKFIQAEIELLEETTGLSIEELKNNYTGFGRRRRLK